MYMYTHTERESKRVRGEVTKDIKKLYIFFKNEEFPGNLAVKDLVLSLLWHGFYLRPRNFCMPGAQPKKKKREFPSWLSRNKSD